MIKILGIVAFVAVLGLIGHSDAQMEQAQAQADMINTCEYSARVINGALEQACSDLIDKVQSDGHHEVLSKDGQFWVEEKK